MPMRQATTKASCKEEVEWIGFPVYINRGWAPTSGRPPQREDHRLAIDDPANLPEGRTPPKSSSVERKGAEGTGNVLIIDGN